jgi:4-amino-4-deoxy-L-arabinose transferase-like glycosyltransferase
MLGIVCALTALTRSEQAILIVVVLVPLALVLRNVSLRRRLALVGVGILAALVIMAPWVGFNLSRFSQPEFLSAELGSALVTANCRPTYFGPKLGYWSLSCLSADQTSGDESARDAQHRRFAWHYITSHEGRLPIVLAARVGREFGLFAPLQQVRFDNRIEGRALVPIQVALVMYYVMAVTSVVGFFSLRRRGVTVVPFIGLLIEVVLTAALLYGTTRFRAPLEVGLVVLSAVVLDDHLPVRGVAPAQPVAR